MRFFFPEKKLLFYRYNRIISFLYIFLRSKIKLYFGIDYPNFIFRPCFLFYNVDPFKNYQDGWLYHMILSKEDPHYKEEINKSKIRFNNFHNSMVEKRLTKTYLFATGPSLKNAKGKMWNDGYKIVCNTIVKDSELWNYIRPDIIVAGDALYHFGDNLFASEFRKDLSKRLLETPETVFIYPSIFHTFVKRQFSSFIDRLIPIPVANNADIVRNLPERFELPSVGNVLNLLLLPVGMTLSKDIYLFGFDGRNPNDKDFWSNSSNHFYSDLVYDIKEKHPMFFEHFIPKGNEIKYVKDFQGDKLEEYLSNAEREGWNFYMMHYSYTPTLQKRIVT